jgi:hypothetical protein
VTAGAVLRPTRTSIAESIRSFDDALNFVARIE